MPQKRKFTPPSNRPTVRKHLSHASITRQTVKRYLSAMNSFFNWRKAKALSRNPDFPDLDMQLAEYLNYLYQEDLPMYLGTNCIAGFKKFHPRCKRHIDTACTWLNNWAKIASKVQAMPLHPKLVKAFVSFGLLRREPEFALAIYVGFLALLRGCEILNLRLDDCQPRGQNQMALILRDTKGAKLRGVPFETVMIKDRFAIKMIAKCRERGVPRLFSGTSAKFSKLYLDAAAFYRLSHPKPTPHGIRRGGASWHFQLHGLYDRTVEQGRWASVRSARIYINEAAAEEATYSSGEVGQRRLNDAVDLCPSLLLRAFS
jgi:integrase